MKSPMLALQKAQYARLSTALSCPLFDDHPEQQAFPYATTGDMRGSDWSAKGDPGQEVTSSVHIWSRYPGKKECLELMDEVVQALSRGTLVLEGGFGAVVSKIDSSEILVDIDGKTRHGIVQWRYKIEEA